MLGLIGIQDFFNNAVPALPTNAERVPRFLHPTAAIVSVRKRYPFFRGDKIYEQLTDARYFRI